MNRIKLFFKTVRFELPFFCTGPCFMVKQGFKCIAILDMDENYIWSASMIDDITTDQCNTILEKIDALNQAWAYMREIQ